MILIKTLDIKKTILFSLKRFTCSAFISNIFKESLNL